MIPAVILYLTSTFSNRSVIPFQTDSFVFQIYRVNECFEVAVHSFATISDNGPGAPRNCWERVHGVPMFDYLKNASLKR